MHGLTIKRHPIIVLLPIFMMGIMIGLGVWGVLAGSQQYSSDKQNQAQVIRGYEEGRGRDKRVQVGAEGRQAVYKNAGYPVAHRQMLHAQTCP